MNEYHNCTEGVAVKVTIIYKRHHEMNAIIFGTRKRSCPLRAAQAVDKFKRAFACNFIFKKVPVDFRNPLPFRQASSKQAPVGFRQASYSAGLSQISSI
ncbi:hypothetical protein [Peribacillus frigoritolerans]|uniref:hypothetical protein n=1 Tax=Peribacillus frigoritolerans TaxID=450367 RepID=UPI0035132A19